MTIYIRQGEPDWYYTNGGYYVSCEYTEELRYKAATKEEAIDLFKKEHPWIDVSEIEERR